VDLDLVESVVALAPDVAASLPMGNEEVDMMGGWSHLTPWHRDATNAAGMLRILAMHVDMINRNATMQAANVTYGYHANDNAFLNYGDAWFQQRTLNARFEMNLTHTVEVVRKPAINTMAMLSLLGDTRHTITWQQQQQPAAALGDDTAADPPVQPATPTSAPYGAIATTGTTSNDVRTVGVVLWNSNGTQPCHADCNASVTLDLSALVPTVAQARIGIRIYRMDLTHGNPSSVFMAQRGGDPKKQPYPTAAEFEAIRAASELPSCDPAAAALLPRRAGGRGGELQGGGDDANAKACDGISVAMASPAAADEPSASSTAVTLPLPQPSAALVHICIAPVSGRPAAVWPAGGTGANLRYETFLVTQIQPRRLVETC
jgi:hypothetical protein